MTHSFYCHGTSAARGVAIFLNLKESFEIIKIQGLDTYTDLHGRLIGLCIKYKNKRIGLINCYAPNVNNSRCVRDDYMTYLTGLDHLLEEMAGLCESFIVGGDFNIILDPALDAKGGNPTVYQDCTSLLKEVCDRHDLVDLFRTKYPTDNLHTFAPGGDNKRNIYRRLDYILISETLLTHCENLEMTKLVNTDHCAISFSLLQKDQIINKGIWRHNDSLLKDLTYIQFLKDEIVKLDLNDLSNCRVKWEFIKFSLGVASRKYSKSKGIQTGNEKAKLQAEILKYSSLLSNNTEETENNRLKSKLKLAMESLDKLLEDEAQSIIFRSRVQQVEQGEKATGYHFRTIKENNKNANITELKIEGKLEDDKKKVNDYILNFYKTLYSKKPQINEEQKQLLESHFYQNIPQINDKQRKECDKQFTKQEIKTTLFQRMHQGRSPGTDGLTVSLYKALWDILEESFFQAAIEGFHEGELSSSQKKSIIRLISKKSKDKLNIDNWRPISLLNVDMKILSKLLAVRMERCLEGIIHEDQTAFISKRNIIDGIRKVEYIFDSSNKFNRQGALISVDFKKAFDSVSHEYLWATLKQFGFGENMVHMIKTLYFNAESAILNEGISSQYFSLQRSCRQGDCLSPYLFIIAIEPLLINIRNNKDINGIMYGGTEFKISAYADDVTLFMRDLRGIKEVMQTLENFGELTGLQINKDKSEVMGMGRWAYNQDLHGIGLKVVDAMKVTGIYICQDQDRQGKLNFEPIVEKTAKMLNAWKGRSLSVFGKVVAVKAHALSFMQFASSVITVPEWVISNMNKIIYKFLWGGPDKIKRVNAALAVSEGGINLPMLGDVVTAAQIQWIRRKILFPKRSWTIFIDVDLNKLGGQNILNGSLHKKIKMDNILSYNQEILQAWIKLSKNPPPDNVSDLKKVSIWHNTEITNTKGLPIYWPNLNKAGIKTVGNLFDNENKLINNLQRHNINPNLFLEWMSVCKSIPPLWTKRIKELAQAEEPEPRCDNHPEEVGIFTEDKYISADLLTQKCVLTLLCSRKKITKSRFFKDMSEKLNMTDEDWKHLFKKINKWSISTKHRSFSWRLFNGVIFTNKDFARFGFKESTKCSFCDENSQDREHLLLTCPNINQFRQEAFQKFSGIFKNKVKSERLMLFGCMETGTAKESDSEACDLLILLMNRYIYYNNYHENKLSQEGFGNEIKAMERIEYAIAKRKGKLGLHLPKWEKISSHLGYNILSG
jgi:exonuclease III